MPDAGNRLDKNQLAENDDEMTGLVKPSPKRFPDKVVDVTMDMASPSTTVEVARKTVEVARVIPQERIKPAGGSASVRERIRQLEMNGISHAITVEVPRAAPEDGQSEDAEGEAPNKRRKQESDPDSRAPCTLFSLRRLERPGNKVGG